MGSKGGTTQNTTQTNTPPTWALPALNRAGQEALRLYDQGSGFNTYTGPPRTDLSPQTLAGMNGVLAATGYKGGPITNNTINNQALGSTVGSLYQKYLGRPADQAGMEGWANSGLPLADIARGISTSPEALARNPPAPPPPQPTTPTGGAPNPFPGMLPVGFLNGGATSFDGSGFMGGGATNPGLLPGAFSLTQRRGSLW